VSRESLTITMNDYTAPHPYSPIFAVRHCKPWCLVSTTHTRRWRAPSPYPLKNPVMVRAEKCRTHLTNRHSWIRTPTLHNTTRATTPLHPSSQTLPNWYLPIKKKPQPPPFLRWKSKKHPPTAAAAASPTKQNHWSNSCSIPSVPFFVTVMFTPPRRTTHRSSAIHIESSFAWFFDTLSLSYTQSASSYTSDGDTTDALHEQQQQQQTVCQQTTKSINSFLTIIHHQTYHHPHLHFSPMCVCTSKRRQMN